MNTDNKNEPTADLVKKDSEIVAQNSSAPNRIAQDAATSEGGVSEKTQSDLLKGESAMKEKVSSENTKQSASVSDDRPSSSIEKNSNTATSPSAEIKKTPIGKRRKTITILIVLLVLSSAVTAASSYLGFFVWQNYQKDKLANNQALDNLKQSIAVLTTNNSTLVGDQKTSAENSKQLMSALQQRLQAAEQRLLAQNKRLQSMSTTSREDWLLAEAEYLLKLANQRVLVERSAESAVALLEEADKILRDMADPDLFSLRQAIASDLAALRLTQAIDVEGLYLALQALAGQVDNIPVRYAPIFDGDRQVAEPQTVDTETKPVDVPVAWWQKPLQSFNRFAFSLNDHVRIKDHSDSERSVVFITPDNAAYLKQNLRMQIERAQLALLREQQKIYVESLLQAAHWVSKYFPDSAQAQEFRSQLQRLADRKVVKTLPDISGSLELLNTYIERLHDLQGTQPGKGSAQ